MHHNGRTETRFIGKNASLEALRHHGADNEAHTAAESRHGLESIHKDRSERGKNAGVVYADDNKAADNKQNDHRGNDFFREGGNSFQAAEHDHRHQCHNNDTDEQTV